LNFNTLLIYWCNYLIIKFLCWNET